MAVCERMTLTGKIKGALWIFFHKNYPQHCCIFGSPKKKWPQGQMTLDSKQSKQLTVFGWVADC